MGTNEVRPERATILILFAAPLLSLPGTGCQEEVPVRETQAAAEPRIQLQGMEKRLSLEIRAPWIGGKLLLRFPETLHGRQGRYYIDNPRPKKKAMSELEPFPVWEVEEATKEVSYLAQTREGMEWRGRATPGEDEVALEFRVKNLSEEAITGIMPQVCLWLFDSEDFNQRGDLSGTYAWMGGKRMSLDGAMPERDPDGDGPPWIMVYTKDATRRSRKRGPVNDADPRTSKQVADVPLIFRVSEDEEHLVAIAWEPSARIMSNTGIPCLHSAPLVLPELEPGASYAWRGKVYWMKNDPEALRKRYLADRERWSGK